MFVIALCDDWCLLCVLVGMCFSLFAVFWSSLLFVLCFVVFVGRLVWFASLCLSMLFDC